MAKKEKTKEYSEKYFEVLKKFGLTPDFKLNEYEKDIVKKIDKVGSMTTLEIADCYDLRPSEEKELVDSLVSKGVVTVNENVVSLTDVAIKFVRASKDERKTEKKFRNFLDCLNEKDLDKFLELVNSFVVKDNKEEVTAQSVNEKGE